jgi:TIR domain-containing protein
VFVSYSRRDIRWLERFQRMMSPLIRSDRVALWDDTKIKPGKWHNQIVKAMSEAHVALFLVSENFLASDFIMQHELPELLRYAEEGGVTVLWVLLNECLWEDSALAQYQAENASRPLSTMDEGEKTLVIKNICVRVRELLGGD